MPSRVARRLIRLTTRLDTDAAGAQCNCSWGPLWGMQMSTTFRTGRLILVVLTLLGFVTVSRAWDGLLGLQLHAGPPMKIEFRNILPKYSDAVTTSQPGDWLTDGGNPRRTAWQQEEAILTTRNARDIKLVWKITLDNVPREMHSLLPALVVGRASTREGPKQIVVVTGVSDNLYAIDTERGVVLWRKRFDHSSVGDTVPRGGLMCPGGITATPVIGPATAAGGYTIYAVSWDGMLHQLNVADGEDVAPSAKFMPPNGKPYALNLWKNVLYTHTAQGCGGHPNMAYAYDLATGRVGSWGPAGGGMWGRTGPAISSKGVMYTGTGDGPWDHERGLYGNGIIGLQQNPTTKALELVDYYAPSNAEWLFKRDLDMQVTPAIFDYKGRELMVAGGKECRAYLMDTESIGGDDHRTPLFRTPLLCNEGVNFASAGIWGAMASWLDAHGTRWVLTPFWGPQHSAFKAPGEHGDVTYGAIAAFRVDERHPDHVMEPLGRPVGRQRPRLPRHVRRDTVLLRYHAMKRSAAAAAVCVGGALAGANPAPAQDWTTGGYDAQRSSWVREDAKISPESMRAPGFQFLWKLKVTPDSTQSNALTPPVLLDLVIGYRGFRSLGFVGGTADHVFTVDTDLGRMEWDRQF